jgi:putative addiction module component (TIGR02574 family)
MTRKTIESAAMKLPSKERGELAAALLSTLEFDDPAEIERAWAKEIGRRIKAHRQGRSRAIPAGRVFAAARAALRS